MEEHHRRHRIYMTAVLMFASLSYGLTSYIMGPALNEFKQRVNADMDQLGLVLGTVGIMYTVGAIVNGILYNYLFNRQLYLAILMGIMGLALVLGPHSGQLYQLFIMTAICGFASGGYDTANIVWVVELWTTKSAIYLLAGQFMFSVGTFLSPLITRSFLSQNVTITVNDTISSPLVARLLSTTSTSTSLTTLLKSGPFQVESNATKLTTKTDSHIEIPFSIVGGFLFATSLLLFLLHFYRRYDPSVYAVQDQDCIDEGYDGTHSHNHNDNDNDSNTIISTESEPNSSRTHTVLSIIIGIFMIGPYVGMEIANFQLISTYSGKSYLQMDDQDSALTQTIMAAAFAVSRGLALFFSDKVAPGKILPFSYATMLLANTAIVLCDHYRLSRVLFFCAHAFMGVGFSAVLSTTYAYLEQHIEITDLVGGLFVCSGGSGIAVFCYLCMTLIDQINLVVYWFNYGTIVCISVAYTLFTILQTMNRPSKSSTQYSGPTSSSSATVTIRPFNSDE